MYGDVHPEELEHKPNLWSVQSDECMHAFLTKASTHEYGTKNSCTFCRTVFSKPGASDWELRW